MAPPKRSSSESGVWGILFDRAERAAQERQSALARARSQVQRLHEQRDRVHRLMQEYASTHAQSERQAHPMRDNLNQRRFLAQLRDLSHRVDAQITQAEFDLESARRQALAAEVEAAKYAKLIERQQRAQHALQERREARALDEWSLQASERRRQA